MAKVFILLGGNVGDKSKIFEQTRILLGQRIGSIDKMSSVYATQSWGFKSDPFWNQAVILDSRLDPFEILKQAQDIESLLGRSKKTEWVENSGSYEDRIIDIDLLFYDHFILNTPELTIPHPRIGERKFVLIPLNEIAPEKCHPVSGMKVQELLRVCPDQLEVKPID